MNTRRAFTVAVLAGLGLGVLATFHSAALAGRNSTGTYSSPSSDFVSGTIISSSVMNAKLSDIGTEITDSLSRSGKGGMLARLRGVDGTAALPAYSFSNETTLGLYRAGSADLRVSNNSTDLWKWTATGATGYQGLTITTTVSNGAGTTSTGNGTGDGVVGTGGATGDGATFSGGATSGNGVVGTGTGNGHGGVFTGQGTGEGLRSTGGGTAGNGGEFTGGAGGGSGLVSTGTGTGGYGLVSTGGAGTSGIVSIAGTAATATTAQAALQVQGGYIGFISTTGPNSNVSLANTLATTNIPKAWAKITTNATATPTVNAGFNVGAAAAAAQTLTLDIASDVDAGCGVWVSNGNNNAYYIYNASCSGSQVTIKAVDGGGVAVPFSAVNFEATSNLVIHVLVFGAQ